MRPWKTLKVKLECSWNSPRNFSWWLEYAHSKAKRRYIQWILNIRFKSGCSHGLTETSLFTPAIPYSPYDIKNCKFLNSYHNLEIRSSKQSWKSVGRKPCHRAISIRFLQCISFCISFRISESFWNGCMCVSRKVSITFKMALKRLRVFPPVPIPNIKPCTYKWLYLDTSFKPLEMF